MTNKLEITRELAELFERALKQVGVQDHRADYAIVETAKRELRALLAAPVVERQPVAWLTKCKLSGLVEQAEPNEKASNPEHWTDAFPVYANQPAPVAVVLPTLDDFKDEVENIWGFAPSQLCLLNGEDLKRIWVACLDKVKELNK